MSVLTKIKAAEEMYIVETGKATDNPDVLSRFFDTNCTAPDGSDCKGKVAAALEESCKAGTIKLEADPYSSSYRLKAKSNTKKECAICVTRDMMYPSSYNDCRPEFKCAE